MFHEVDGSQFDVVTFGLDGVTHFAAWVAHTNVARPSRHIPRGRRGPNGGNQVSCLSGEAQVVYVLLECRA